jgi:hypothetical protein
MVKAARRSFTRSRTDDLCPVKATWLRPIILALIVAAALTLLLAGTALADNVQVHKYGVEETFTIELNAVGDAHFTDVLKYDPAFFNNQGVNFDKYPFLLSRRYKSSMDTGEIANFAPQLDKITGTVTLAFDQTGRAYNEGNNWVVYGFAKAPKFDVQGKQVFEEETTVNSDFTLWQDLDFKTTTYVQLPAGASNVKYDQTKKALTYELAYVPPTTVTLPPAAAASPSFLQRGRTAFIPVFIVVIVAALAGLAIIATRRSRLQVLPAAVAPQLTGRDQAVLPPSPPQTAELNQAPTSTHFCRFCGHVLPADDTHFCPGCGKEV